MLFIKNYNNKYTAIIAYIKPVKIFLCRIFIGSAELLSVLWDGVRNC